MNGSIKSGHWAVLFGLCARPFPTFRGLPGLQSGRLYPFRLGLQRQFLGMAFVQQARSIDRLMELACENFPGRQFRQIFGHMNAGPIQFEQLNLLRVLPGAQDDPKGRRFIAFSFILVQPAQV